MTTALFGLELLPGFERIVHNLTRIFHVGFLLSAGLLTLPGAGVSDDTMRHTGTQGCCPRQWESYTYISRLIYQKIYQQQMIGEGNDIFLPVKCKRYSVRLFYIFGWKCGLNRIHLRWWWLGRTVFSLSLSALSGAGFVLTFCIWTS